jgi:ribosomal subunit interface protein
VTDELREAVTSRFARVSKQADESAHLEVELWEEKNPRIRDRHGAEANLWFDGGHLFAKEVSPEMLHSIHELAEDIRRQVKRKREKQRKRHQTRRLMARFRSSSA